MWHCNMKVESGNIWLKSAMRNDIKTIKEFIWGEDTKKNIFFQT